MSNEDNFHEGYFTNSGKGGETVIKLQGRKEPIIVPEEKTSKVKTTIDDIMKDDCWDSLTRERILESQIILNELLLSV